MKKIMFLLMFSMILVSTSCEKEDVEPKTTTKTLEQQFPEWKNLTWVSTVPAPLLNDKLNIKIVGNVITVTISNMYSSTDKLYSKMELNETVGNPVTSGKVRIYNDREPNQEFGGSFTINRTTQIISIPMGVFNGGGEDTKIVVFNLKIN
jgi:hypothetical protein